MLLTKIPCLDIILSWRDTEGEEDPWWIGEPNIWRENIILSFSLAFHSTTFSSIAFHYTTFSSLTFHSLQILSPTHTPLNVRESEVKEIESREGKGKGEGEGVGDDCMVF